MYSKFDPYEINVDAVKGYFKKRKVLAAGILFIVNSILLIALTVMAKINNDRIIAEVKANASENALDQLTSGIKAIVSSAFFGIILVVCVFAVVFFILAAISYISLYKTSRSEKRNSRAAAAFFFVVSVIKLSSLSIIFCVHAINTINLSYSLSGGFDPFDFSFSYWLIIAFCVIALTHSFVQAFYSYSIGKSMRSVELKSRGAKAYGLLSIILAVFIAVTVIWSIIVEFGKPDAFGSSRVLNILFHIPFLVMSVILVLQASVAIGYKKYIDGLKSGYNGAEYKGLETPAPVRRPEPVKPEKKTNDVDLKKNPYADLFDSSTDTKADKESFDDLFGEPEKKDKTDASAPVCPKCGNEIPAGSAFCNHCGAKM